MEVSITRKHSNVYYVYKLEAVDGVHFFAVEKAKAYKNNHGLDLFTYRGNIFEGRSGCKIASESASHRLDYKLDSIGGVEEFQEAITKAINATGESPRYTRPDERKRDIFPPRKKNENSVLAKDAYGNKHYYFRFHNENGVELFTLKNQNERFHSVFVQCEGYMIVVGQKTNLDDIIRRVAGFENGIKGEIERIFNESMANPQRWAEPCFAEILGRVDEAKAHNTPIREARELERRQRDAENAARRTAIEQAEKEAYEKALRDAEHTLLNKGKVVNSDVLGDKSLVMQLFREFDIAVPLRTQGWIISSLQSVFYSKNNDKWGCSYTGNPSTVFFDYLERLIAAVQTKQQYEEMNQNSSDELPVDNHIEAENEDDMEI